MGGHAFIKPGEKGTPRQQQTNARHICKQIMTLVERDYNIVVTHGNGPQVGNLLLKDEAAGHTVPRSRLDVLVAQTEGSLGYYLQLALLNELRSRSIRRYVVTVVTQVLVDEDDPAFQSPSKPIGPFMTEAEAIRHRDELGWIVGEDAARGWRRLVPSPRPVKVIQSQMVQEAAAEGHIVVAGGGGGIPIIKAENGDYQGIEAVIDKDLTSSVLANDLSADLLIILTAVDRVYLNYATDNEIPLGAVTLSEAERYVTQGHFPRGSMGPKVKAIVRYLENGGKRGLITDAETLHKALDGNGGTHFVGRI